MDSGNDEVRNPKSKYFMKIRLNIGKILFSLELRILYLFKIKLGILTPTKKIQNPNI